jgi:formylglycine-generating enzyme required for sulfatase activity
MAGRAQTYLGIWVVLVAGCWLVAPLDDVGDAGDASMTDGGASDGMPQDALDATDADARPRLCGSLHDPEMIMVSSLNPAGPKYCIDSTEVTEAQYQEFLDAKIPTSTQPSICAANASFNPDITPTNQCSDMPFNPTKNPTLPVACVDWCDALAYCKWAGKRLCGGIGRDGGNVVYPDMNTATLDQWFNACSNEGTLNYPYGDTYDAQTCDGVEYMKKQRVNVASLPGCVGGSPGIFDMSGNVAEWEYSCLDASADGSVLCNTRGGSFSELSGQLLCIQGDYQPRNGAEYNVGFRCCADL